MYMICICMICTWYVHDMYIICTLYVYDIYMIYIHAWYVYIYVYTWFPFFLTPDFIWLILMMNFLPDMSHWDIYKILYGLQPSHVLSTCKFMLVHHEKMYLCWPNMKRRCSVLVHIVVHMPQKTYVDYSFVPCLIGSQKSARLHWFVANMIPSIPSGYDCHGLRTWSHDHRNSGFTQLENGGSFHSFLYDQREVVYGNGWCSRYGWHLSNVTMFDGETTPLLTKSPTWLLLLKHHHTTMIIYLWITSYYYHVIITLNPHVAISFRMIIVKSQWCAEAGRGIHPSTTARAVGPSFARGGDPSGVFQMVGATPSWKPLENWFSILDFHEINHFFWIFLLVFHWDFPNGSILDGSLDGLPSGYDWQFANWKIP